MIDKTGRWWTGEGFEDLRDYLVLYTAENYPAGYIVQSICTCGGAVFDIGFDADEGCAKRRCNECGKAAFIADSEDYWDDADPHDAQCPCGRELFQVGVGFSLKDDGDVRWVMVAGRCVGCGVLGTYVD